MTYEQFKQAVEEAGLSPKWCDYQHWQIRGGQHVVNFYPDTKRGDRFYVDRAEHGTGGPIARALRAAKGEIQFPMLPEKQRRGQPQANPQRIHGEIQSRWRQHKKSGGKLTLEQFAERAERREREKYSECTSKAALRRVAERVYDDLPDGAFFAAAAEMGLDPEDFID